MTSRHSLKETVEISTPCRGHMLGYHVATPNDAFQKRHFDCLSFSIRVVNLSQNFSFRLIVNLEGTLMRTIYTI